MATETGGAYDVPFTQYLLPDGTPRPVLCRVTGGAAEAARGLVERGIRFEAEVLRTGLVSLTAEAEDSDGDDFVLAIEVCPNDARVLGAVERLISRAQLAAGGA